MLRIWLELCPPSSPGGVRPGSNFGNFDETDWLEFNLRPMPGKNQHQHEFVIQRPVVQVASGQWKT